MKRTILSFLLLAFVTTAANAQLVKGDMNDDGTVDVSDVTMTVSTILGNTPLQTISGSDLVDPYATDNAQVSGTWWKTKYESVTFNEDGTTSLEGADTYAFQPFLGRIVFYKVGVPVTVWNVVSLSEEAIYVNPIGTASVVSYTKAVPIQLVTNITLDNTSLYLMVNAVQFLIATVSPSDADNSAVVWSSSDESVAEVNQSGRVITNGKGTCVITCAATDGSGVTATCTLEVLAGMSGIIDGIMFVDLDLPSGTLWAACNIGANSPEDCGDYFAWGETEGYNDGKTNFKWDTYKWLNEDTKKLTKYCSKSSYGNNGFTDTLTELGLEDDAAYVNWGSNWRIPSKEQFDELINSEYTSIEWTTQNGVNGRKITSVKSGNSIFLPAAGFPLDGLPEYVGTYGRYWSRTLNTGNPNDAWDLYFGSGFIYMKGDSGRFVGWSVRPVRFSE